ncbi:MAG: hypothetical protein QM638_10355, partial [Nocardioides sp.]
MSVELERIANGKAVRHLTSRQRDLVGSVEGDRQVPAPVAGVSPSSHPRVGEQVAFFDGTADGLRVRAGSVSLHAWVTRLVVKPLGAGHQGSVSCPGSGVVAGAGDTPGNTPGGCWWKYVASSAGLPGDVYPVEVTAFWRVDSSVGGGSWTPFTRFTKSQVTRVPVTEIQTL